ncbi:hypothetical protein CHS0354_019956 [Potamilus streckersoni]|uniref:Uncharacterized protein n=1 Tax=Potamilus streckersoni TaxID=2493646 RepID=A0AAE0S0J8_9BIVA|nr:hypothetical protein CHS0354_019956 [Potamilus streckersoni]
MASPLRQDTYYTEFNNRQTLEEYKYRSKERQSLKTENKRQWMSFDNVEVQIL